MVGSIVGSGSGLLRIIHSASSKGCVKYSRELTGNDLNAEMSDQHLIDFLLLPLIMIMMIADHTYLWW